DKGFEGAGGQFPQVHAWPGQAGHRLDLFAASFSPDLTRLLSSTAIGSMGNDVPAGCWYHDYNSCSTYVAGFPPGPGYPSPGRLGTIVSDGDSTPGRSDAVVGG